MNLDIIYRYLSMKGRESLEQERDFAQLFCDEKKESNLRELLSQDWDLLSENSISNVDLSHLQHNINYLIKTEKSQKRDFSKPEDFVILKWYSRIAAILLIPVMVWAAFQFNRNSMSDSIASAPSTIQVRAPLGSRVQITLPDGSTGWLNSGSELEYEVPFDQRRLMVRGEAFFDVVHDSLRPLIVEGTNSFVKVLGTKFNVKMWPEEAITEVVLAEGSVELQPKDCDNSFRMHPGDMFVYNKKNNKLTKERVNPDYYSAWIDGKLVLRNVHLKQMARELSRWFNVDVETVGSFVDDHVFRATFEDEKLEEVLRLIKMTAPIDYSIIDNQQKSNGDFAKKKVVIMYKEE